MRKRGFNRAADRAVNRAVNRARLQIRLEHIRHVLDSSVERLSSAIFLVICFMYAPLPTGNF